MHLSTWLKPLFHHLLGARKLQASRRPHRTSLRVEEMESRWLPSVIRDSNNPRAWHSQETGPMQYPSPDAVQQSLKLFAEDVGDTTDVPFRVNMVPRYGGKPPLYTVIIRCAEKEPIREKLAQVLNRRFSLGATSFALDASEAQVILQYQRKRA